MDKYVTRMDNVCHVFIDVANVQELNKINVSNAHLNIC